jgi:UDP-N-acetylglucosamine 4,6-dehydratase
VFTDKSILITGGTGSFGQRFARSVLERHTPSRVVIYSRDELKQFDMQSAEPFRSHPNIMRFFLGDVRDGPRLQKAMEGVDVVIHAAALKQVPAVEYNPFEAVKTNILGAENVINAALANGVKRVIALSTDKAAAPINLYGATKLVSDKLFVAANNHKGLRDIRFSVVRYGNVMGSRGSVIPFFLSQRASGVLPITDPAMTRFNISLQEGVDMVLWSIQNALGGEILVPRIPSYRITDVATAIGPNCRQVIVGVRPGEKIHEEMITASDSLNTLDLGDYYAILPAGGEYGVDEYVARTQARRVTPGFSYDSGSNPHFLSVAELRELIFAQSPVVASLPPVAHARAA